MNPYVQYLDLLSPVFVPITRNSNQYRSSFWTYFPRFKPVVKYRFWTPSISTRYGSVLLTQFVIATKLYG